MIDGQMQLVQQMLGRLKAEDFGQALLQSGENSGIQPERLSVLLDKAGSIVSHGLIAGQGFVQGLDVIRIQRGQDFHVQQLGDFFEISLFRHGGPPLKGI
jgi:hypothetical protein